MSAEQLCVDVARLSNEQWKVIDALASDGEGSILPTDTDLYTEEELSSGASCVWQSCTHLVICMSTGRKRTTTRFF